MFTSLGLASLSVKWGSCVPGRVIVGLVMKVKCLIKDAFCSTNLDKMRYKTNDSNTCNYGLSLIFFSMQLMFVIIYAKKY